jgi:hypothetical protein
MANLNFNQGINCVISTLTMLGRLCTFPLMPRFNIRYRRVADVIEGEVGREGIVRAMGLSAADARRLRDYFEMAAHSPCIMPCIDRWMASVEHARTPENKRR